MYLLISVEWSPPEHVNKLCMRINYVKRCINYMHCMCINYVICIYFHWYELASIITSLKRSVASMPSPFINSSAPPGWYSMYGVTLYTWPVKSQRLKKGQRLKYNLTSFFEWFIIPKHKFSFPESSENKIGVIILNIWCVMPNICLSEGS